MSFIWENLSSMLRDTRTETASKKMHFESKKKTNKKLIYYLNCGIIQGFPALRKGEATHVKKITIVLLFRQSSVDTSLAFSGQVDK